MFSYSVIVDERPSLSGEPTRFRFLGFSDEAVERFERDIAAVESIEAPITVTDVHDAMLSIQRPIAHNCYWGNVFGPDRRRCEEAVVRHDGNLMFGRDDEAFPADPPGIRLERAWYGGLLFNCYGHLILESLSRLTAEVIASDLPIVFHADMSKLDMLDVFRSMLAFFGVDPTRLVLVDRVLAVGHLRIPAAGIALGRYHNLAHVRGLHSRVKVDVPPRGAGQEAPILLSRSALRSQRRRAFGEADLESWLCEIVRIVHPQTLPFGEQVAMANRSDRYLGFIGSQMHNLFFRARPGPIDVLYLTTRRIEPAYFQVDLLFGGSRTYVNAAQHGPLFDFGSASPFLVRSDLAVAGLKMGGLVPWMFVPPPGAHTAEALAEDFCRAWASRFVQMKFIGPSRFWSEADLADRTQAVIDSFVPRLSRLGGEPRLAAITRAAAADTLRKSGKAIAPEARASLLNGLFGAAAGE